MSNGELLTEIRSFYPGFTKAEQKVADYILTNPQKVLFMSISELSEICGVGDTSVFRFCKSVGVKGYQEFKMKLSLDIHHKDETDDIEIFLGLEPISLKDSFELLSQKVLNKNISALNETYQLLKPEEFSRSVYYFKHARQIQFLGVGSSMITALAAASKFLKICPKVQAVADTHMQAMQASMLTSDDVAVVISFSGATKDTVHVAQLAKEAGAKVIGITRYQKSPLAEFCDILILCGSDEAPLEGSSISAQLCQLYIIDLLYMEYYKRTYETSSSNNKKTSAAVVDKLY